jgi:uncharacterized protein YceK
MKKIMIIIIIIIIAIEFSLCGSIFTLIQKTIKNKYT